MSDLTTGLLWHDSEPKRTAVERIVRAAEHYTHKFGHRPNTCHVNADQFADWFNSVPVTIEGVRITPSKLVDTNYFWIGVA